MRYLVLLLCLLAAGCQAGSNATDEAPRGRDTFGGRCSPYSSNCW